MKNTLSQHGIKYLYHTMPLHYLVFICRTNQLFSKEKLIKQGYNISHFRSSSRNADVKRGFGKVVHCTNNPFPPILISKLHKGYQHLEICTRADTLAEEQFLLCKYNIAKNRGLYTESLSTGKCYDGFKIPVAKSVEEKIAMLSSIDNTQHIEILIKDSLAIPDDAIFRFLSNDDAKIANEIFSLINAKWSIQIINHSIQYDVDESRSKLVKDFLKYSLEDKDWKGNGLEFDR